MRTTALLATTYFGPIQWYQKLYRYDDCEIERMESFQKQTYRNRCVIATTNGAQALIIPIEQGSHLIKDTRLSDHGNWRHLHWNALCSAYGESPFFEFYQDDIRPLFEKKWEFLYDFNWEITQKMCELLEIQPQIRVTETYEKTTTLASETYQERMVQTSETYEKITIHDFREVIRPKHPIPDVEFTPLRYYQVYERKHGFLPNLSILDLLFNMGNESLRYL